MFDILTKTIKVAANVATLPVSVVADAVTLGGELTGRRQPYTMSKGKRILEDTKDVIDDIAS